MSSHREIITLQFGHYANYIGTHFWNLQVCIRLLLYVLSTIYYMIRRLIKYCNYPFF